VWHAGIVGPAGSAFASDASGALPYRDFGASASALPWIVNAYVLAFLPGEPESEHKSQIDYLPYQKNRLLERRPYPNIS
jgi:hypothetical protein